MIKTKTLFILGAGASRPFGYLTSIELRDAIRNKGMSHILVDALTPSYEEPGWYERAINKFVDEFSRSSVYSIDFFLEHRPDFMDIGKMAIAAYLIQYENDEKLRESKNNWYMYLYDRLKCSFEDFDKNSISFITFNYDRSLEQFFFEAIRSRFDKPPDECAKKLKNIPITHLYGQLDFLPWQGRNGTPYSAGENLIQRVQKAKSNIKLISGERDVERSEEFRQAYNLIAAAQRIYFLGFSFDETNIERLNIALMKGKTLVATALGLEESKKRWVRKYFENTIGAEIFLFELDSLSLLQKDLKIE